MSVSKQTPLTYKDAGVDIDAGEALVDRIKPACKKTLRPEVLGGLGQFAGLFDINASGFKHPILVAGTDGVGTKLRLALDQNKLDHIGIDLVGMCVNDVSAQGAEPLFFLDYYACGKLDVEQAATVINGIAHGCELAGCALLGGETAEMPGHYKGDDFDLAGFCVGAVEKNKILGPAKVVEGDVLVAVASSGPHSNGYSLIRKILERIPSVDAEIVDALLRPTDIYSKWINTAQKQSELHAIAHITGGGITENVPRMLPPTLAARLDAESWEWPNVFNWLAEHGQITKEEMLRTFNCGIGLVIALPEREVGGLLDLAAHARRSAWVIGDVITGKPSVVWGK